MSKFDEHNPEESKTLELCRTSIDDLVRLGIAAMRAGHFNRNPVTEHHIAVVEARWNKIEAVIFRQQAIYEGGPAMMAGIIAEARASAFREASNLAATFDLDGTMGPADEDMPKGWAGCRRAIADHLAHLSVKELTNADED